MKPRDILLAVTASVIWGLAFVATRWGVESFTAAQLTALRFFIACLPVLFLPRPRISWPLLIATGATLFLGQFFLIFLAFGIGDCFRRGVSADPLRRHGADSDRACHRHAAGQPDNAEAYSPACVSAACCRAATLSAEKSSIASLNNL
jgi:hypothetical protein